MRLAHFSDIHVTHFPLSGAWALKRMAAVASYSLMGRGRRFDGAEQRIEKLLADVDGQGVDHALCTGDLTGVALDSELDVCASLFGARLTEPERYTVLPGNHDRYTAGATRAGRFEKHFGALGGQYPLVKALPGGVTLVALDSARPTSLTDSSGLVGPLQLKKAEELLTDSSLKERFVVLALHYGLLRSSGLRDRRAHGLRDDRELMALVDRPDVRVDLILHGHMHRAYAIRTSRRLVLNAGSATDLHTECGYNVYDIDPQSHRVVCHRRVWHSGSQAYQAASSGAGPAEYLTR